MPVSTGLWREGQGALLPVFSPGLSPRWPSLFGLSFSRSGIRPSLPPAYQAFLDRYGVVLFRSIQMRTGRMPPIPRGRGDRPTAAPVAGRHVGFAAIALPPCSAPCGVVVDGASSEVHFRSSFGPSPYLVPGDGPPSLEVSLSEGSERLRYQNRPPPRGLARGHLARG
jgi:hypothetical protein